MARRENPGVQVVLWLAEANEKDFRPKILPEWMKVKCFKGSFGTGIKRIWADHFLGCVLPLFDKVDVVHYPKGWMPLCSPGNARIIVSLHDTIPLYYRENYPGYMSSLKTAYFNWNILHSLRKADSLISGTNTSARELIALNKEAASRMVVIPSGWIELQDGLSNEERDGLLVVGSRAPHKATAETLQLLNNYAAGKGSQLKITVTGLSGWSDLGDVGTYSALKVDFSGKVSDERFCELMRSCRALIHLSRIEGFGLPVLEAYSHNTPVCYRKASSLAEILEGIPGGWDGKDNTTFSSALNEVLAMTSGEVNEIKMRLAERYNETRIVDSLFALYKDCSTEAQART